MTSYDVITPASIGTGVAKTSLGTNTKPTQASELIEFIPFQAPTGVLTAGQSMLTETAVESNSINLLPKRVINAPIVGGLALSGAILRQHLCKLRRGGQATNVLDVKFICFNPFVPVLITKF